MKDLTLIFRVAYEQAIFIKKDGSGFIKADTVLSEITTGLIIIPFKGEVLHSTRCNYNVVVFK